MIQNNTPTSQAYAELQIAFDHYNQALFDGALPACLITMQRKPRVLGYYAHRQFIHRHEKSTLDEIAMNPAYFGVVPLLEILQTLVHEMVHAWQRHFGQASRRGYHNRQWADKMEAIGLMPSSTGKPGGARVGEAISDYPIAGSMFMLATQALLETGFNVTWLDRFPPVAPADRLIRLETGEQADDDLPDYEIAGESLPIVRQDQPLLTVAVTSSHAGAGEAACDGAGETNWIPLPPAEELRPQPYSLTPADVAGIGALSSHLSFPTGDNRSNRVKYRCPSCGAQVWGKPNLRLKCGMPICNTADFEKIS